MTLSYGVVVPQGWWREFAHQSDPAEAYETMTRVTQEAEKLGYDSAWLFDHLFPFPADQEITFECWTSMAALARDTQRIRLGQMVTCNGYRNPALLAKMASTVDVLSHGRLELGIGAGWNQEEYQSYGYPYPDAAGRVGSLGDAVQILRAMWTEEQATFEGRYHQVRQAINQPKSVQKPHIPLLIGGEGEKVTLKLVAQYANAWNLFNFSVQAYERKAAILKKHCETVGRPYDEIRKTLLINCAIGQTIEEAHAKLPAKAPSTLDWSFDQILVGTPDMVRDQIAAYEKIGVQEIVLWFVDLPKVDSLQLFASAFL